MRRRQVTVKDVVDQLGGSIQAAAKGFTTTATIYKAMRDKRVRLSTVVLLWAEALEPTDLKARWQLARQLAGLMRQRRNCGFNSAAPPRRSGNDTHGS